MASTVSVGVGDKGTLLEVKDLVTTFTTPEGVLRAVDGVSFEVKRGSWVGLVGESGSGKSVTALSILRLLPSPPGRVASGSIRLEGAELLDLPERQMREVRGNAISMIFQEPMTSLNPVYTVGAQIVEAIRLHQDKSRKEAWKHAEDMLRTVGIPSPETNARAYPHQLSGGMRQRVMIAMALACQPKLLLADEPTTALDVTIQAQILELLRRLQRELSMGVLFITHDLGVVAEYAEEVLVMYAAQVVERGSVVQVFTQPRHPYTRGLLESRPRLRKETAGTRTRLPVIPGIVPNLLHLPVGCRFADRCALVVDECTKAEPPLRDLGDGRWSRCFRAEEVS